MEFSSLIFVFIAGLLVGAYFTWIKSNAKGAQANAIADERKRILDEREEELAVLRESSAALQIAKATLEAEKEFLKVQKELFDKDYKERSEKSLLEFESLAQKVLDKKTVKFDETSQKELSNIINPLKEDIKLFKENINTKHQADLLDRSALKNEIKSITETGKELKASTDSFTKALRGDSKAQGRWGELVLERILESSGLRKGEEFFIQESFRNEEGELQLPDVTVKLSNQKQIIIDSKVSLTHYDRYIHIENDVNKSLALDDLESAFCARIKELSDKNYQTIQGISTLDFVILFTPIESAFSLIVQNYEEKKKKSLFEFGWSKGVIIASPLTLMPILKTINICWIAEHQNSNALKIAEEAGRLYEKFEVFVSKFEKINSSIAKTQESFNDAKKTLIDGKGSIIKRFEIIRQGLKRERKLSDQYCDEDEILEISEDSRINEGLTEITQQS